MTDLKKETYQTGAQREVNEGKGRFDQIPPEALTRVAKRFQFGSQKYGDNNWKKGMPLWRFIDSALRHIMQYQKGEKSEDHLSAAVANLMMLMELENEPK